MTWLVTGGAGYIGAHTVRDLRKAGHEVVVIDDLSTGFADRLAPDVPLISADVGDRTAIVRALRPFRIDGVLHFAAKKSVTDSIVAPLDYWRDNVGGVTALLEAMVELGIGRLVFSSSAAVYGPSSEGKITEDAPAAPINPYGESKLVGEWVVRGTCAAHGISWISLRYFNAVGAASAALADRNTSNLLPLIFEAMEDGRAVTVHGGDYATPDGTALRDYVHVDDLASAHMVAVERLLGAPSADIFNVGTGRGSSVLDMVQAVRLVTGRDIDVHIGPRRPGDPAEVVAKVSKIEDQLGWRARHGLVESVRSAWRARVERHAAVGQSSV